MRLLFAACFSVTLLVLIAIHGAESGYCDKTNVCPAIKALETKLEKLIALVTPPGILGLTDLHWIFVLSFFFPFFSLYQAPHPSLIFFTVIPASSCKELHEKHK